MRMMGTVAAPEAVLTYPLTQHLQRGCHRQMAMLRTASLAYYNQTYLQRLEVYVAASSPLV